MDKSLWEKFWEFNIQMDNLIIQIGIIIALILIANTIRRKVRWVRLSLVPTSIVAGILILLLRIIPYYKDTLEPEFMEMITYHSLAIGCIAIALKTATNEKAKESKSKVMDTGLIVVNTYLIQGIFGVIITIALSLTLMSGLLEASGLLLPLGFGQGSGQAMNFGIIFEDEYGFVGGKSFGLAVAAIGFLVACIGGLIHLYYLRKTKKFNFQDTNVSFVSNEEISSPNDIPLTESVDRFTIQTALIVLVYFLTFLFMLLIEKNVKGNFGEKTIKPLIFGFNFLIGTIIAIVLKVIFKRLKQANIMTRDYPNNYLLNRISGFMFDLMIVAGIGAIEIDDLRTLFIPLVLICIVGTYITYVYLRKVCKDTFPNYTEEAFVSLFGMLTGTTSTGMILLREVDPKFETPAASNLIFQSVYAIAFGFPLFLLLGYAPNGLKESLITFGVLIIMFIIFQLILYRSKLFNKKA